MPLRTFFALDLDEMTLGALVEAQEILARGGDRVRWVEPANMHVTLKFLGDVPDGILADVCLTASEAACLVEPFEFAVHGLICSPPRGRIRMVWARVTDPTGRMARLHYLLEDALADMGLKADNRSFKPHITVGRVRYLSDPRAFKANVQIWEEYDFGSQSADELMAYTSTLTPEGPIYTPLARAPIGE